MADNTIEKTPTAGVSVNQPESGTFGEKIDEQRLRDSLPPLGPGQGGTPGLEPSPMPSPTGGMPAQAGGRPPGAPEGVPSVLLQGEPPALGEQPNAPAANPQAARISLLEQLVTNEEVSETTREWARIVLEALRGEPGEDTRA